MLWIRIETNSNPDSAFYLYADPVDQVNQTNVDPGGSGSGPWSDFIVIKV
jgi:hypothetical protein